MKPSSFLNSTLILLTALGLSVACTNETNSSGNDGGAGGEGGSSATGGSAQGGSGNLSAEANSCLEVMQAAQADDCDSGRQCNYVGYAGYCESGNAKATEGIFRCLSDFGGCHTPWDPGNDDVASCINEVLRTEGSALSSDVHAAAEKACGMTYHAFGFEMSAAMAGATQGQALLDCLESATDCDAAMSCFDEAEVGFAKGDGC